ncbi:MAG: hypothetical protein ABWY64_09155 [Tardiphaga sp.]
MARTPRSSVSQTSGQGVSRLSYQKAYRMKHQDDAPGVKGPGKIDSGSSRGYAKKGSSAAEDYGAGDFNVSYGDTIVPTDLKELGELRKEKPAKPSLNFDVKGPKKKKK